MVNLTRRWLNKIWNKDQHLAAVLTNKPHQPKSLACLVSDYVISGDGSVLLSISILSLACGTVFQVLISRICLQVLLGLVPCLRVGLLSGMALQRVLIALLLSDAFVRALSICHFLSLDVLLLLLRLWHLNNLCSLELCSTSLLWTWFVISFSFRCNHSEMYEMFCVVISGLTFVWVLSADPGIAWLLARLHSRNYRCVPIWVRFA